MALSFVEKFKKRKEQKQKEAMRIEKNNKLIEACKVNFETFKLRTSACQAKIGKFEESITKTENSVTKTTTVYTEYGPITKKEVREDMSKCVNEYIEYEGYIPPKREINEYGEILTSDEVNSFGYFNITTKTYYLPDPIERETAIITHYKGTQMDCKGNVNIIQEAVSSNEESNNYLYEDIVKNFEQTIKDIKAKQSENETIK